MSNYSYLTNAHAAAIEDVYAQFQSDPFSVDVGWRAFFEGFALGQTATADGAAPALAGNPQEIQVLRLIHAYRMRGHLFTHTNPVRERRKYHPTLAIENFGLTVDDLPTEFQAGIEVGLGPTTLQNIIDLLHETYCRSIGAEFTYMLEPEMVEDLQRRMESSRNQPQFTIDEKKNILHKLNQAVVFEKFLHTKFVGQKRFSLEGAETLIPALNGVILRGSELGAEEFVIGMAHRGRLNVLANTLRKTYQDIFTEFEGKGFESALFEGDVKYHLGFSSDQELANGKQVHLSLTPNPSHLEAVDPVMEGAVRAKLDNAYGGDTNRIVPIMIHGDASVAGQGIVYEVLQMARLPGFQTGGTIHIVINNQIGFTTNYLDGRSSTYCTDVAKVTKCPVFHVNGDDVEAVVYVTRLAMEWRQQYHRDIFIDLLCYRRHGHNEGDEPRFTQPILYKIIESHPNPREIYNQKLIAQGSVDAQVAAQMEQEFSAMLQERLDEAKQHHRAKVTDFLAGSWKRLRFATDDDFLQSPVTAVAEKNLQQLGNTMLTIPAEIRCFQKIRKLFEERKKNFAENRIDWAGGEWLAYASLLTEGTDVRLTGQDVERGTFAHRHAVVLVEDSEEEYVPLRHLAPSQGRFEIYNSLLSEYGVLGFEFGYAMASPQTLVLWEAQFGDFSNGAQIIFDQFISCAETKWQRMNGLVLLLPHGYEGQGPEHSSARPERYLELYANNNLQVANCTTPANFFHLLRRQMQRDFRKPLVVMTPKSLLRHPACVSPLADFANGGFREVIDDANVDSKKVQRVLCCTGKIYYELLAARDAAKRTDVAIVRIEQLAPFPTAQLEKVRARYNKKCAWVWVQEEPGNMGAWSFIWRTTHAEFPWQVVARKDSSSPATGFHKQHVENQAALIAQALG